MVNILQNTSLQKSLILLVSLTILFISSPGFLSVIKESESFCTFSNT